jgi:ribonucleoside-diphosphate reductase alpha chain
VKLKKGESRPQCSACFINSVKDSLESILDLAKTEGMLFKWGSGTGTNLSPLREEGGGLAGGGTASGPLSFMKGFDAFAGVIKSGGKTRRAAKMVILNVDHPDIESFIWCKAKEEKKAHTLIDAGYDAAIDGDAYGSIFFQNANNSVRVTDEFMEAVRPMATGGPFGGQWPAQEALQRQGAATRDRASHASMRRSGHAVRHHHQSLAHFEDHGAHQRVESVLGVHVPGRFGLQPGVVEPDEVRRTGRRIRCRGFPACVRYGITLAQEIIVDSASYPTERIAKNSHDFRPLGLGYANLGALLMSMGIPYDSPAGRDWAAAITAVMCGQAYLTSARIAEAVGPCPGYAVNEDSFLDVILMHGKAVSGIDSKRVPEDLFKAAVDCWNDAYTLGERVGFRNAQTP